MADARVRRDGLVATAPVGPAAFEEHATLAGRGLNFTPISFEEAVRDPDWHADERATHLATEPPGAPCDDGPFAVARAAMGDYVFADPAIVRAVFDPDSELAGRDLLLVGRFLWLRFPMGVRIGGVEDGPAVVDGRAVHRFRWHYQTLEGHLERGRMDYELLKDEVTGRIEFRIRAYSQRGRIGSWFVRLGFRLFGRWTQLRFYERTLARMRELVADRTEVAPGA